MFLQQGVFSGEKNPEKEPNWKNQNNIYEGPAFHKLRGKIS